MLVSTYLSLLFKLCCKKTKPFLATKKIKTKKIKTKKNVIKLQQKKSFVLIRTTNVLFLMIMQKWRLNSNCFFRFFLCSSNEHLVFI